MLRYFMIPIPLLSGQIGILHGVWRRLSSEDIAGWQSGTGDRKALAIFTILMHDEHDELAYVHSLTIFLSEP